MVKTGKLDKNASVKVPSGKKAFEPRSKSSSRAIASAISVEKFEKLSKSFNEIQ